MAINGLGPNHSTFLVDYDLYGNRPGGLRSFRVLGIGGLLETYRLCTEHRIGFSFNLRLRPVWHGTLFFDFFVLLQCRRRSSFLTSVGHRRTRAMSMSARLAHASFAGRDNN